jgi:hypothetical protein
MTLKIKEMVSNHQPAHNYFLLNLELVFSVMSSLPFIYVSHYLLSLVYIISNKIDSGAFLL